MSSILTNLATEILEVIVDFLSPIDLCALRLVCRDLSRRTLDSFGRANFATLGTDLSQKSLQRVSLADEFTPSLVLEMVSLSQFFLLAALIPHPDARPCFKKT